MNTPTIVSMKDIRLSLAAIARRVEAGERFIVVRDSKPIFQIEPLAGSRTNPQRGMSFDHFTQRVDRVRDAGETEWAPEAVEHRSFRRCIGKGKKWLWPRDG
jgi:antitoxin (DNA-binding transcriptional repressor) of toxin-antitoxin stability system